MRPCTEVRLGVSAPGIEPTAARAPPGRYLPASTYHGTAMRRWTARVATGKGVCRPGPRLPRLEQSPPAFRHHADILTRSDLQAETEMWQPDAPCRWGFAECLKIDGGRQDEVPINRTQYAGLGKWSRQASTESGRRRFGPSETEAEPLVPGAPGVGGAAESVSSASEPSNGRSAGAAASQVVRATTTCARVMGCVRGTGTRRRRCQPWPGSTDAQPAPEKARREAALCGNGPSGSASHFLAVSPRDRSSPAHSRNGWPLLEIA